MCVAALPLCWRPPGPPARQPGPAPSLPALAYVNSKGSLRPSAARAGRWESTPASGRGTSQARRWSAASLLSWRPWTARSARFVAHFLHTCLAGLRVDGVNCMPCALFAAEGCVPAVPVKRIAHPAGLGSSLQATRGDSGLPDDAKAKLDATVAALDRRARPCLQACTPVCRCLMLSIQSQARNGVCGALSTAYGALLRSAGCWRRCPRRRWPRRSASTRPSPSWTPRRRRRSRGCPRRRRRSWRSCCEARSRARIGTPGWQRWRRRRWRRAKCPAPRCLQVCKLFTMEVSVSPEIVSSVLSQQRWQAERLGAFREVCADCLELQRRARELQVRVDSRTSEEPCPGPRATGASRAAARSWSRSATHSWTRRPRSCGRRMRRSCALWRTRNTRRCRAPRCRRHRRRRCLANAALPSSQAHLFAARLTLL